MVKRDNVQLIYGNEDHCIFFASLLGSIIMFSAIFEKCSFFNENLPPEDDVIWILMTYFSGIVISKFGIFDWFVEWPLEMFLVFGNCLLFFQRLMTPLQKCYKTREFRDKFWDKHKLRFEKPSNNLNFGVCH